MNEPHDFDDAAADALLAGQRQGVSPQLADFVGDVRVAYTSTPAAGAEIAALMGAPQPLPARSSATRRSERMRSTMLAKIGAATAVVVAATGGLAAAHALPAPVEEAVSHLGIGTPLHSSSETPPVEDSSTSTTLSTVSTVPTPTTADPLENHGGEVSAIAHDHSSDGCAHGAAVSAVASGDKSRNDSQDASDSGRQDEANEESHAGSCETTTTIGGPTPLTTIDDNDADEQGDNHQGDNQQSDGHHDGTSPTTVAGGNSSFGEQRNGGHHDGSSGDTNSSSRDHGGSSGSGGGN
jgi:uncharacterized membrane protein YgcG